MSAAGKSNPLAINGLVVLALIWSYSWILMKQVTSYIGAFGFTASHYISGAFVLFIVLLLCGRVMRPTPFKYTLAITLLQTCGMIGLVQWALVSGGAGRVAVLSYAMPFWMVVLAALFLGERLRRGQYFTILVAAFDLFLVLQPWQLDFSSVKSTMLAILSGVSWGANAIIVKRLYTRHPRVDLLSLTSWQMLYTALMMGVVTLLMPQREVDWQPTVLWVLVYGAILTMALAWSLRLFVLKSLPTSIASLSILAVPVCDILFSWWLLGENPDMVEDSGIVLIVLALAPVSRKKKEAVSVKSI